VDETFQCVAVFPKRQWARDYFTVMTGEQAGANRQSKVFIDGKTVTWTATLPADYDGGRGQYLLNMREHVGHWGSTPGEPPFREGAVTATLNGRDCPPSF